jgi:hypothetical protein
MMNWEKYLQVRGHIDLSRDWQRFVPPVDFQGREGDAWEAAKLIDAGARRLVREMQDYAAELEQSGDYVPEAIERKKQEFFEKEIAPKLKAARTSTLSEYRARALAEREEAMQDAYDLPKEGFPLMLAELDLQLVREGMKAKGKAKMSSLDVERLPLESRKVIAAAKPHHSGLSEEAHARIRKQFNEEAGGYKLAEAEALVDAIDGVENLVDYAQVACEKVAGVKRSHPLAEAGREMREVQGIPESEPLLAAEGDA